MYSVAVLCISVHTCIYFWFLLSRPQLRWITLAGHIGLYWGLIPGWSITEYLQQAHQFVFCSHPLFPGVACLKGPKHSDAQPSQLLCCSCMQCGWMGGLLCAVCVAAHMNQGTFICSCESHSVRSPGVPSTSIPTKFGPLYHQRYNFHS